MPITIYVENRERQIFYIHDEGLMKAACDKLNIMWDDDWSKNKLTGIYIGSAGKYICVINKDISNQVYMAFCDCWNNDFDAKGIAQQLFLEELPYEYFMSRFERIKANYDNLKNNVCIEYLTEE